MAIIKIDTDFFPPSIDTLVSEGLSKFGVPQCFGNMVPPMLHRIIEREDTEVLAIKKSVVSDQIHSDDIGRFIKNDVVPLADRILTKEGFEKIQKYKREIAEDYVAQVGKCLNCNCSDICYKLTANYLRTILLEETLARK